jgi:glyoxylase-like metal-dependent hydrolase (beta-lactamase superfamily II)
MHPFSHDWMTALLARPIDDRRVRGAAFVRSHGLAIPEGSMPTLGASGGESWFGTLPPLARPCADGNEFEAGGRSWRMIETGGHCRGHLCLYCEGDALLVSGDQVLPTISPNVSVLASRPEGDPLREFLASLSDLERCREDALVLPSHGRPFRGLHRRIEVLKAHHRDQLDILRTACRTPQTAAELVPALFGRALRGFQRYLAVGEAVAHLNYLWHSGELRRSVDEQGVIRFVTG